MFGSRYENCPEFAVVLVEHRLRIRFRRIRSLCLFEKKFRNVVIAIWHPRILFQNWPPIVHIALFFRIDTILFILHFFFQNWPTIARFQNWPSIAQFLELTPYYTVFRIDPLLQFLELTPYCTVFKNWPWLSILHFFLIVQIFFFFPHWLSFALLILLCSSIYCKCTYFIQHTIKIMTSE